MIGRLGLATCILFSLAMVTARAQQASGEGAESNHEAAIFAGGCFWCMESAFDPVDGVVQTISGYTGGKTKKPTYDQVQRGNTGHYESLKVVYDPGKVTYDELLEVFWHNIDPFNPRGQFCDTGSQYRAAIFVANDQQREAAEKSKRALSSRTPMKVVTQINDAGEFYPAEEYHQDYYIKNPIRYRYYRNSCGRDARLIEIWGAAAGH